MITVPIPVHECLSDLRSLFADRKVLILGGGIMQLPLVQICRHLRVFTVVVDANPAAAAVEYADDFLHVDLKDADAIASKAARYSAESPLHGVCTVGTDFSTSVAYAAEKLGLPGIPLQAAEAARYKHYMRDALAAAGLPTPTYIVADRTNFGEAVNGWYEFPAVIKPVDNMGARGVQIVRTSTDLYQAADAAFAACHSGKIIIEGFIPGSEYSIDAVWQDNLLVEYGVAERHIYFDPYRVELGHSFPAPISTERKEALLQAMREGSRALGVTSGAVKGDVFWDGSQAVIGELAARLSGGFMSGWTYPLHSGTSALLPMLGECLGISLSSGRCSKHGARPVVERALLGFPGVLQEIRGIDEAGSLPGVHGIWINVSPGQKLAFPRDNVGKCGNIIAFSQSAARAAAEALEMIMMPGNAKSLDFLLADTAVSPLLFPLPQFSHVHIDQTVSFDFAAAGFPLVIHPDAPWWHTDRLDWLGRSVHDHLQMSVRTGIIRLENGSVVEHDALNEHPDAVELALLRATARAGSDGIRYLYESFRGEI